LLSILSYDARLTLREQQLFVRAGGCNSYGIGMAKALSILLPSLPAVFFGLYTQTTDSPTTPGTHIGFAVPSVDSVIVALSEYPTAVVSAPKDFEWGRRAVVSDRDGHRVELIEP